MEYFDKSKFCRDFLDQYSESLYPELLPKLMKVAIYSLYKAYNKWYISMQEIDDFINYFTYNNQKLELADIMSGNEIIMSVILGNDSLDNGVYSFKMTTDENLSFQFRVWLNNTKPDILVSHEEGTKTTDNIIVRYNTDNLFDAVGDCVVKINDKTVSTIDAEYFQDPNYEKTILVELKETSPYLI